MNVSAGLDRDSLLLHLSLRLLLSPVDEVDKVCRQTSTCQYQPGPLGPWWVLGAGLPPAVACQSLYNWITVQIQQHNLALNIVSMQCVPDHISRPVPGLRSHNMQQHATACEEAQHGLCSTTEVQA